MRVWAVVAAVGVFLAGGQVVEACSKSWGDSAKDKDTAKKICDMYKNAGRTDVETIMVKESIVFVDVSKPFYWAMLRDRVAANKFVADLMGGLRSLSGREAVTAWIYVDKVKAVEGDTTWTGETKVKFLLE